eukprot:CAMPEP_0204836498 /NCGR_PEP_ID=MMETSP1346-20131115/25303_1 /ASSEMBLY_ACC=CAM_ASM_000771 /TAXON_ID=215587 /ORGANISM="Aplanochytrium stocchinoi, Strain GSBS06" /LENGTH=557 /DNA_ID=CAMNT_0051971263 /DNA_START=130 /DNA_END=1803 /DNA_ORIENTATION=+
MRGPSSSHTAAANRIGRILRPFCMSLTANNHASSESTENEILVMVKYDPAGSLATTAGPQGSNIGLAAGILGFDCKDERLKDSETLLELSGISFTTEIGIIGENDHPNTYHITIKNPKTGGSHWMIALSTGGGAIHIQSVDGVNIDSKGDRHMCLLYVSHSSAALLSQKLAAKQISCRKWINVCHRHERVRYSKEEQEANEKIQMILIESLGPIDIESISDDIAVLCAAVIMIPCVMPVPRPEDINLPFTTCSEMQSWMGNNHCVIGEWLPFELACQYESARSGLKTTEIVEKMAEIVDIYDESIKTGLRGTTFEDRILGAQSVIYKQNLEKNGTLYDLGLIDSVILYTSAFMEMKSSFGLIVAGPTAGSCGTVPGCIIAAGKKLGKDRTDMARALLVCGLVGVFIATKSTFAAEEGGCQAECGAAGAMAAAGLVALKGGDTRQCFVASSLTLQSLLGMVCDPIGNRVEAPCLMRNVCAASMACSSANMAMSNYTAVIPFDEVIAAHWEICKAMPRSLRCTGLGGLAAQPSARKIEEELLKGRGCSSCSCSTPFNTY